MPRLERPGVPIWHARRRASRGSRSWSMGRDVLALSCLAGVLSSALAGVAHGAEGQWRAGGRLGAAVLRGSGAGASAGAFLSRGIHGSLDLDLQVLASLHPLASAGDDAARTALAFVLSPGVSYRWDVLRAVPYVGVGAGFYAWREVKAQLKNARFGAPVHLGVDYVVSRDVVLSGQATAHLVAAEGSVRVPWFQVGIGASHAWGW